MDKRIPFFIQQIKEHSKWYFGHDVQVITFIDPPTRNWQVVVYPADCNLVSAVGREIHLHATGGLYGALSTVLGDIKGRIGKCFYVGGAHEAPILQECEAPCKCLQQTVSLAMAGQGGDSRDGEMESPHLHNVSGVRNISTDSGISGPQANTAQDILPVIQKIQRTLAAHTAQQLLPVIQQIQHTLEAIEQRMRHCPVETSTTGSDNSLDLCAEKSDAPVHSPVEVVTPTAHQTLTGQPGGSSALSEDPHPGTDPATPEFFAPHSTASTPVSHSGGEVASGGRVTLSDFVIGEFGLPRIGTDEVDEHIRDLIREEIGRVLAGAMGSLARKGAEI